MRLFGVWYDDGRLDFGWLSQEHGHGRQYPAEYDTMEEAEAVAQRERERDDSCVFIAAARDADERELFEAAQRLAKVNRIRLAKRELERARKAAGL